MPDSDQNSQIVNDPNSPNEPLPPGDGDGGGNGHPPPVRITSIAPIAGILAGGSDVTIDGFGFQPGAELFFGTTAATDVQVQSSTQVMAKAPAGTQTGTVPISIVNPDGSTAQLANGFTYFTGDPSNLAEVLGVEPPNIIEDSDTQVTIRGRNLIAAHENGLVAFRGPARAAISVSDFSSSRDEATGVETLACTVRVVANPPLAAEERMAIQVLASARPEAQTDGIAESSKEMFVVLPRSMPVTLAYTKSVDPTRPNLVIVTGRNLEGCSLDLGANATIHAQRSEDEYVAVLVSYPGDQLAPQLAVRDGGGEVARLEMSVTAAADTQAAATMKEGAQPDLAIEPGGDPGDGGGGDGIPGLTPVPGQQVVGPTAQSSTVVTLGGQVLDSFSFDWSSFAVSLFRITFRLRIANFIKVVAFFDGGGEDVNSPVLAKVGHLMPLRGMGILVALRVEIIVSIRLLIIVSWKHGFDFSPWGSDPGFGLGSLVIGFELDIDIDIEIFFMVALVLPNGSLKVLALEDFDLNFHFQLNEHGDTLKFNKRKHQVRPRRIGPLLGVPLLCEDRFQLADDNGQTSFTDASGGTLSYYFVRGPGRCCLRWNFDLDLVQFIDDGPETIIQPPFDADFCLNALDSENQNIPIVISGQCPRGSDGIPGEEHLTIGGSPDSEDNLGALIRRVDPEAGNFLPTDELGDVTKAGYTPYFYLRDADNEVLDPHSLFTGKAVATKTGENRICVQLSKDSVTVIDTGVEAPSFWPGAVTGFSILSFLARGLAPALLFECASSIGLPVRVKGMVAPPGTITVTPVLAFHDPNDHDRLKQTEFVRNEPFDPQQVFVLAVRVSFGDGVDPKQKLTFSVDDIQMAAPLANLNFSRNRDSSDPELFFDGTVIQQTSTVTLEFTSAPDANELIELKDAKSGFTIFPNNAEVGPTSPGDLTKLVPPGKGVSGQDAKVSIKLKVGSSSNTKIDLQNSPLELNVRNEETFEEYLRVFQEVSEIMHNAGDLENFEVSFDADLPDQGTDIAKIKTYIKGQGEQLWKLALTEFQNHNKIIDDRPLYWVRLKCIAALRAYLKRNNLTFGTDDLRNLINEFELPSRGLETNGSIKLSDISNPRKVIFTGFDPFELPSEPRRSNPSGVAALSFNKKDFGGATVRSAIFPVRYLDFDKGMIENAVKSNLGSVIMIMTCSENGGRDFYDVERWAAKNRGGGFDNNHVNSTSSPSGDEFLPSTLPYELVITTPAETLAAPIAARPFVIDQSYSMTAPPPVGPHSFPSPQLSDDVKKRVFWCTRLPQEPLPSGTSVNGSGGAYLSNEIFYRVAVARGSSSLATGHFHIPATGTDPQHKNGADLISGVSDALTRFVTAIVTARLTSVPYLQFTGTQVTKSKSMALEVENESTAPVTIASGSVQAPFSLQFPSALPIVLSPGDSSSLTVTFTPTTQEDFTNAVRLRNPADQCILACTVTGKGIPTSPDPEISGFSPDSGPAGTTLIIDGLNLNGATSVAIAGVTISKLTNTDTRITARVSGAPRIGKVSVTTPSGTAISTDDFEVTSIRHPPDDLAAQLVARRQELNLNPQEAAAQIGAKPATYRRWERGKDKPSGRFHAAIVTFLGHDPDRDPKEFGQQIKTARERDGLTRTQLARQLGIAPSTVKAWEDGNIIRPNPRVEDIFEDYLNAS